MLLNVNGVVAEIPRAWQEESLLSVLREHLGLVGTKYGCGVGVCGACTVHVGDFTREFKRHTALTPARYREEFAAPSLAR